MDSSTTSTHAPRLSRRARAMIAHVLCDAPLGDPRDQRANTRVRNA